MCSIQTFINFTAFSASNGVLNGSSIVDMEEMVNYARDPEQFEDQLSSDSDRSVKIFGLVIYSVL